MALRFVRVWLVSLLTLGGIFGGTAAFAAEPEVQLQVVAFDKQDNDTVAIGFEIENQSSATADLRYRLEVLAKDTANLRGTTDVTEYKTITVAPHAVTRERFSYTAPLYVGGEQELFLAVTNTDGFPIAGSQVGSVSFTGTVIPATLSACQLVDGGKAGITVTPGMSPLVTCTLQNTSDKDLVMLLSGDLSLWGIAKDRQVASTEVTLSPGKDTLVTLTFPPISQAGRYEGRAYLGTEVSHLSPVEWFQVIVLGESAHIAHITLDKDVYQVGETARVTAIVSLEPGSDSKRPTVKVSLQDGKGTSCATPVERAVENGFEEIELAVEKQCPDPKAIVAIVAASGSVLDTETLTLTGREGTWSGLSTGKALGALIVGILCLVGLTAYLVIRQRRASVSRGPVALALALMIVAGSTMLDIAPVFASTFSGFSGGTAEFDEQTLIGLGTGIQVLFGTNISISGPIRINGSVVLPGNGQPMRTQGNGNRIDFYKGSAGYVGSLFVSGGTVSSIATSCGQEGHSTEGLNNLLRFHCNVGEDVLAFTDAPPPPVCVNGVGPYTPPQPYDNAWCQARGYDVSTNTCVAGSCICTAPRVWNGTACAPPVAVVNGVCGANSANPPQDPNRTVASAPSVFLCDSGTPTAVPVLPNFITVYPATGVLAPAWQWTCVGSGGGANATCWVFQSVPPAAPSTTFTGTYVGPPAQTNQLTLNLPAGGGNVLLNWSVANAVGGSCTGYSTTNLLGWSTTGTAKPVSGINVAVNVVGTTRFDLDCRNASGTAAPRRSVQVNVAPTYTYTYCPANLTLDVGNTSQLHLYRRADATPVVCATPFANPGTTEITNLGSTVWTSNNAGVAAVNNAASKGLVTAVAGSAVPALISATDSGASTGLSVPVTVNLPPPPDYRLCPISTVVGVGGTTQVRAYHIASGSINCSNTTGATEVTGSVNWSSSSGIATVDNGANKGRVSGISAGNASISASSYLGLNAAPITITVTCAPAWNCDTYAGRQANACPAETWTVVDSCGGTRSCSGTRSCDFNWKEVQQQ
jgi:hypothetical protein